MQLILASQSPYRKKQMDDYGLNFKAITPLFDEDSFKKLKLSPEKLASRLAYEKAKSLREKYPNAWIIGSDQLVALGSKILGKPGTRQKAISQLTAMSGRSHRLITAVTLAGPKDKIYHEVIVAKVKMRKLSRQEILTYVYRDKPYDCAGSYRFESAGYSLVEKISVSDPSSLMGLPMIALGHLLRKTKEAIPLKGK